MLLHQQFADVRRRVCTRSWIAKFWWLGDTWIWLEEPDSSVCRYEGKVATRCDFKGHKAKLGSHLQGNRLGCIRIGLPGFEDDGEQVFANEGVEADDVLAELVGGP